MNYDQSIPALQSVINNIAIIPIYDKRITVQHTKDYIGSLLFEQTVIIISCNPGATPIKISVSSDGNDSGESYSISMIALSSETGDISLFKSENISVVPNYLNILDKLNLSDLENWCASVVANYHRDRNNKIIKMCKQINNSLRVN